MRSAHLNGADMSYKPLAARPLTLSTPVLEQPAKPSDFPSLRRRVPFHGDPDAQAAVGLRLDIPAPAASRDCFWLTDIVTAAERHSACGWFATLVNALFAVGFTAF